MLLQWLLAAVLATPCARAAQPAVTPTLRILSLMTIDTMSHHLWMAPLTVRLAERGHRVHSVDVAVPEGKPPNLNVTVMKIERNVTTTEVIKVLMQGGTFEKTRYMFEWEAEACRGLLQHPALQQLTDPTFPGKFDLLIFNAGTSDCLMGFAHRFHYPATVVLTPFPGVATWIDSQLGNPALPAVIPHAFFPTEGHPMSLWERMKNLAVHVYENVVREECAQRITEVHREVFGPGVPHIHELRQRVSLALVNESPVLDPARPFPPGIIPVGGMHTRPANLSNIPADLKQWMDNASDGFIFMSFGSIVKGSNMDSEKLSAIVNAFTSLKQRVLWKYELDNLKDSLPSNVRTEKWLPQNDVLGHPNIRLFISHAGGLSTQEAAYQGVPVLAVPHFGDQHPNADKLLRIGMGRKMAIADITNGHLLAEVQEMLNDPRYRESALRTSQLLRDQKETALDRAVWWVEYVARHGGAPHLRSPALQLRWYQLLLLDVHAVLALATAAVLLLLPLACCCSKRANPPPVKNRKID